MRGFRRTTQGWAWLFLAAAVLLPTKSAHSVPSFARQTGMDCSACHTVFPELTPFGRRFKLSGYTLASVKWITGVDAQGNTRMEINPTPPLSGMFQTSHQFTARNPLTYTAAGSDGGGSNSFPSQFSLFYAGALTPKMGAFVQVTYDPASGFIHFDNSDIRYSNETDLFDDDLIFGIDINNNPTVQDVWNSTPAWGFPFSTPSGSQIVSPIVSPMIESMANSVASIGAYAYWDDLVYLEVSDYRSADPLTQSYELEGLAPYWRLAVQQEWDNSSLEAGTFGMAGETYPTATPIGLPLDNFTDIGLDSQYQYIGGSNIVTLKGSWIQENQVWNASNIVANPATGTTSQSTGLLRQFNANAEYYYNRMFGATVGYFNTQATEDHTLYAASPIYGSQSGTPNTDGMIYELDYVPWYNTKFSLQYTAYSEFNGGGANYDGNGRNAWDNNVFMLMGWFAY